MNSAGHKLVTLIWVNQHIIYVSSTLHTSHFARHRTVQTQFSELGAGPQSGPSCQAAEDGTLWVIGLHWQWPITAALSTDMRMKRMNIMMDATPAWHTPWLRGKVVRCSRACAGAGRRAAPLRRPGWRRGAESGQKLPSYTRTSGWRGLGPDTGADILCIKNHENPWYDTWTEISYKIGILGKHCSQKLSLNWI